MRHHVQAWQPLKTSLTLSPGPAMVRDADEDDEPFAPTQPVGFAPSPDVKKSPCAPVEPLLWEGDDA